MSLIKPFACALLGLTGALAAADGARSPVRAQLEGFLAAFNSGDRATVAAFERDHAPPGFTDATMEIYEKTGRLDLLEVAETSPLALTGKVREHKTGAIVKLVVQVNPAEPTRITTIMLDSGEASKK